MRASDFIEDYTRDPQFKNMDAFYEKYRTIDVLLIDDIQMMSNALKSQDEFLKYLNCYIMRINKLL